MRDQIRYGSRDIPLTMKEEEGSADRVLEALQRYQESLYESYKTPEEYHESMSQKTTSETFADRITSLDHLYRIYPDKDPVKLSKMAADQRRYVEVGERMEEETERAAKSLGKKIPE